ncbi:MAG: KEOPS complex kinase/ATPase Bud32 [Candidatus Micrarchaeia archaeon]
MGFLARGAEAELYVEKFLSRRVVAKRRVEKKYRIKEMDVRLRKSRTRGEAYLLHAAKEVGVNCPVVFEVKEFEIKLELIDGVLLREFIEKKKKVGEVLREVGRGLAKLHSAGIVHGDFTTANVMVGKRVVFIDFGLGGFTDNLEEKAVDVLLMKRSLGDEKRYKCFLMGYREYAEFEKVLEKLEEIERRGRYVVRSWAA